MTRVISIDSVRKGNADTMRGKRGRVSVNGSDVSVRCRTRFGTYVLTFSKQDIINEARKAFAKITGE